MRIIKFAPEGSKLSHRQGIMRIHKQDCKHLYGIKRCWDEKSRVNLSMPSHGDVFTAYFTPHLKSSGGGAYCQRHLSTVSARTIKHLKFGNLTLFCPSNTNIHQEGDLRPTHLIQYGSFTTSGTGPSWQGGCYHWRFSRYRQSNCHDSCSERMLYTGNLLEC